MNLENIIAGNLVIDSRGTLYEVDYVQTNTKAFRAFCKGILKEKVFSSVWNFNGELLTYDEPLEQPAQEIFITEICTPENYPEMFL